MPCPGPLHFSHIADYIYYFCLLPDLDVGLSVLVCDVEHIYFACLVSVQISAPYVIDGSTQELIAIRSEFFEDCDHSE